MANDVPAGGGGGVADESSNAVWVKIIIFHFVFLGLPIYVNNFITFLLCDISEEKEDLKPKDETTPQLTPITSNASLTQAPTVQPEVDEDGYCIQPKDPLWEVKKGKKKNSISNFIIIHCWLIFVL